MREDEFNGSKLQHGNGWLIYHCTQLMEPPAWIPLLDLYVGHQGPRQPCEGGSPSGGNARAKESVRSSRTVNLPRDWNRLRQGRIALRRKGQPLWQHVEMQPIPPHTCGHAASERENGGSPGRRVEFDSLPAEIWSPTVRSAPLQTPVGTAANLRRGKGGGSS